MKPLRFYEHFAVAYGTIWFVLMAVALITGSHIRTGEFGLVGFPILALIYAAVRRKQAMQAPPANNREEALLERIMELEREIVAMKGGDSPTP